MNLMDVEVGRTYVIRDIDTHDPEMDSFLFRLGAYSGEQITVVSRKRRSCIVAIRNSRYSLDRKLAQAIQV